MNLQVLLSRVPIVGHFIGNASINVTALAIECIFVIIGAVIPLIIYAAQNKKGNSVENIGTAADKNIFAIIGSFVGMLVGKLISDLVNNILYFFETPTNQAQNTENSTNNASSNLVVATEQPENAQQSRDSRAQSRASRAHSSDSGFHPYQDEYEANYAAEAAASRKRALSQSDTTYSDPVILSNLRQSSNSSRSWVFPRQQSSSTWSGHIPMSVLDLDSLSGDNRPDNESTRLTVR